MIMMLLEELLVRLSFHLLQQIQYQHRQRHDFQLDSDKNNFLLHFLNNLRILDGNDHQCRNENCMNHLNYQVVLSSLHYSKLLVLLELKYWVLLAFHLYNINDAFQFHQYMNTLLELVLYYRKILDEYGQPLNPIGIV